ncbi:MAG TPA: FBP domain-containing protein [Nocardioides sp.]|nr:FBP domain-containing protein [Nocardioides sp.]
MSPLTEAEIRASFVNCSKGEAKRLSVPRDLAAQPWDDLDFLGWRDPQARARGYLVAPHESGLIGVVLRAPDATSATRKNICSLCITLHPRGGVTLLVAPRSGRAGAKGDSVGTYICADLRCSLYARKKLTTGTAAMHETLEVEQRVERLRGNLADFLRRVDR